MTNGHLTVVRGADGRGGIADRAEQMRTSWRALRDAAEAAGRGGRRVGARASMGGVIPILTPEEMSAIDASAAESVEVLIGRAGAAVARVALRMLGGGYGRRVVVVCGKGNNGNDGRAAARVLRRRGVSCIEIDAAAMPDALPACDLVIDAAYGTGFRGRFEAPRLRADRRGATPRVLAVDIPSGVVGLTGEDNGEAWAAASTVTFAALKPGLLLEPGASLAGDVILVDVGLDVPSPSAVLIEAADVARWLPAKPATSHKWTSAVWVIGGSPGLEGAAFLTSSGALRAGAGYVRSSSPCGTTSTHAPVEVVSTALPGGSWATPVLEGAARFGALVIGNGLGLEERHRAEVARVVAECPVPCVVDADALTLLGGRAAEVCRPTTIVTPHDGEYERLMGIRPGADRFAAARALADRLGCVALLKGPCTLVAAPGSTLDASRAGDVRLATLGSGDVLAGVIGALCARGLSPQVAAVSAAVVHGMAGSLGWRHGLVAGDLPGLLPTVFADLSPSDPRE